MQKKTKLLCAVGDKRYICMCRELGRSFEVAAVGSRELSGDAEGKADALVLPMLNSAIVSEGDVLVKCADELLSLRELLARTKPGAPAFGALPGEEAVSLAESLGHELIDYFKDTELVRKNCIPTAEAALELAMHELPVTVRGTRTLITGYGNVAKECAALFSAVGSEITCAVRRSEAAAEVRQAGYKALLLEDNDEPARGCDIIINTVPALILDERRLAAADRSAVIIDLASKPGGTDFDAANRLGLRAVHALGLPGKYAPASAGIYIAETVGRMIEEYLKNRGVKDDT